MINFTKCIFLVTVVFLMPEKGKAQAPNLGSAAGFALYTTVGAMGNTGTSQITGNVGTNSGGITGFGNVNGVMHNNDGATLAAAADLLLACAQIDTITATGSHAPLLGNGDTMVAGVYAISGNTVLAQNLYLNAAGNMNAVFIFKIAGTFSLNSLAQVKLINGAMACNVFWKIEGLTEMAPNSVMKGTVIANNAAINMNSGVSLEGRALSTAGAVAVNGTLTYTPIGCNSPHLTGPAAPNLASTSAYALFTSNGANANAGTSLVTGDVGTNVGLTTGYDSINVNGMIHPIPDGSTASCAADLINVYNYLNTLPADIELLYPAQFGNSLVLTPHTYIMNGAPSFTDTLYLNAQGDSNAVFVIKINGALSTSTYATVTLINGAKARNVYWKVDGAVNINNFSIMKGTIVANNGAISLTTGVNLEGRAMSTNGAFDAADVVARIPTINSTPLAVDWLYFKGKNLITSVLMEWATTANINNSKFILEKSLDGSEFRTIATVNASTAKETKKTVYTFTDHESSMVGYYRISTMDPNGKIDYFRTIMIKGNEQATEKALFYPNPWTSDLRIYIKGASALNSSHLKVYSALGTLVTDITITEPSTSINAQAISSGIYYYQLTAIDGSKQTGKLVSQGR